MSEMVLSMGQVSARRADDVVYVESMGVVVRRYVGKSSAVWEALRRTRSESLSVILKVAGGCYIREGGMLLGFEILHDVFHSRLSRVLGEQGDSVFKMIIGGDLEAARQVLAEIDRPGHTASEAMFLVGALAKNRLCVRGQESDDADG